MEDVFFVFSGDAGACVIPQEADSQGTLLDVMLKLPRFDYELFGKAMTSAENDSFLVWKRED